MFVCHYYTMVFKKYNTQAAKNLLFRHTNASKYA